MPNFLSFKKWGLFYTTLYFIAYSPLLHPHCTAQCSADSQKIIKDKYEFTHLRLPLTIRYFFAVNIPRFNKVCPVLFVGKCQRKFFLPVPAVVVIVVVKLIHQLTNIYPLTHTLQLSSMAKYRRACVILVCILNEG